MWSFYTVRGSDFGLFESMHPWDNSGQLWFKMALDAYEKTLKKSLWSDRQIKKTDLCQ
jgi:hypothetical protein